MRHVFLGIVTAAFVASVVAAIFSPEFLWAWLGLGPLLGLGLYGYFQTAHSIPSNFPLIGRMRYLMDFVRPEIYQYFIENDTQGVPFDRDQGSLIYQRAKKVRDTVPFGTKEDVYAAGYEWVNHSMAPLDHHAPRLVDGNETLWRAVRVLEERCLIARAASGKLPPRLQFSLSRQLFPCLAKIT